MTPQLPDDQGVPIPPEDATQEYARRVWRDVKALLIAGSIASGGIIAVLLAVGYKVAGAAGATIAAVVALRGLVLVARKLLTY